MGNPWKLRTNPLLTRDDRAVTLTGGTAGSIQDAEHQRPASSAPGSPGTTQPSEAGLASDAYHALSAMIAGFISRDRELLDEGFETLVEVIEVMRDAVPKA